MPTIDTILDTLSDALEAATPAARSAVLFKRYRGGQRVEDLEASDLRVRAFQWRQGATALSPRKQGTASSFYLKQTLNLIVGYDFSSDLYGDDSNGLGPHWMSFSDEPIIVAKLHLPDVFSALSGVDRFLFLGASTPGPTSRTYTWDLTYLYTAS
jgi:hypothetical protein